MDRRNFFKKAAIGGATGFACLMALKSRSLKLDHKPSKQIKSKEFDPDKEYGNEVCLNHNRAIKFWGGDEGQIWDFMKKIAYQDMLKVVPEKYRYRVQFRTQVKDYGRILGLCWYYPAHGKYPVYCNGKYLCDSTRYLPLPVKSDIGGYGII